MLKRLKLTEWFEVTATVVMFLGMFAAGVAGWTEQNGKIQALDDRITTTENLINVKLTQAIDSVVEFKTANEKAHDEIKSMLREMKRSNNGTARADSRDIGGLP